MDDNQARTIIRLLRVLCGLVAVLGVLAVAIAATNRTAETLTDKRFEAQERRIADLEARADQTQRWKQTRTDLERINAQAIEYLLKIQSSESSRALVRRFQKKSVLK